MWLDISRTVAYRNPVVTWGYARIGPLKYMLGPAVWLDVSLIVIFRNPPPCHFLMGLLVL